MGTKEFSKETEVSRNLLEFLPYFSATHPLWVLGISVFLALVSIKHTVGHLDFETSRNDVVSQTEPAVKRFSEISDDFGRLTNAVVVVEGVDLDRMKQFIMDLAPRLESEPNYFDNLLYRIDTFSLEGKKLLYLSEDEIADLKKKFEDYGELIEDLAFTPQLSRILAFVNQKISEATVSHLISSFLGDSDTGHGDKLEPESLLDKPDKEKDPVDLGFLRSLLTEMRLALQPGYRFQSPWDTFFDITAKFSEDGFLTSNDDRFAFMILNAKSQNGVFTKRLASLERLRHHIHESLKKYPELKAGVTGGEALATDEMSQAMRDTMWASALAFAGIGILFIVVFRQLCNPLLALCSLILAICWTFGWVTLTIGYLTILSVAFTPILLGLGIDFGIHILARYSEERGRGLDDRSAIGISYRSTGRAVMAGALTTALAFFAIMLADFRGIQELGFIAGSGVLFSLLTTFTVLPALLSLAERKRPIWGEKELRLKNILIVLEKVFRYPKWVLWSAFIITCFCALVFHKVYFDYNLLNLQARGTESVEWERKITEESDRSSWFAVTTADSLDEVRHKERIYESLPVVRKVDSLADLIPENQIARIRAVQEMAPLVENYPVGFEEPEPLDREKTAELLEKIKFKLRVDARWDPQKKPDEEEIILTRLALSNLTEELKRSEPEVLDRQLTAFQKKLFQDFSEKFRLLKNNVQPSGPIREEDVPEEIKRRFQGESGRYLLQIFPEQDIWQKENMTTFVSQLQEVEKEVTGPSIVGFIAIDLMKKGYLQGALYAIIAIFFVVLVTFRRIKETVFALIPLIFTVVWTLGWMGWLKLPFNLANAIALPLLLGIVVDDGIHVVHRFRENPDSGESLVTGSTAQAISLTSWTTMIGFGSLLISKHYGIFSLGLLVSLAVGTAWILSLILLPVLLSWWGKGASGLEKTKRIPSKNMSGDKKLARKEEK